METEVKPEAMETEVKPEAMETEETPVAKPEVPTAVEKKVPEKKSEEDELFEQFYEKNQPDISSCLCHKMSPDEAEDYSNEMENSDYLIVIHCTHGVNRSGYLVGRFLTDKLGLEAEEAVNRVEEVSNIRGWSSLKLTFYFHPWLCP